jgi:hypothetical protein
VFVALSLQRPLLPEGDVGVGKTDVGHTRREPYAVVYVSHADDLSAEAFR